MEEGKLPTSHPVDPVLHLFTTHLNQTIDTTLPHQQEVGAAAPESTETRSYPKVSA